MTADHHSIPEDILRELKELRAENGILRREKNKFGLNFKRYPEQGEAQRLYNGEIPFLAHIPEHSTVKDTPQRGEHVLIEGDNISALVALQATHKGKVDVIYIDPPYNTGNNDFVYNDRYVSNDDGFRHSKWLSFMERRLVLAKELLSETGVIFVSIDDNEQAALKLLMDSVFGEGNFVDSIMVELSATQGMKVRAALEGAIVKNGEFILAYQKSPLAETIKRTPLYDNVDGYDTHYSVWMNEDGSLTSLAKVILSDMGIKKEMERLGINEGRFSIKDLGDLIKSSPVIDDFIKGNAHRIGRLDRAVQAPDSVGVTAGRFVEYKSATRNYYLTKDSRGEVKQIVPLSKNLRVSDDYVPRYGRTVIRGDMWKSFYKDMGNVSKEGGVEFKNGKKPVRLIKQILKWSVNSNPNAVILDFFAGSGTTGHAVAALNAEDGGSRQAILVTNNFEQDGSPNGIARDMTAKRMEAVLTGKWADGKKHEALPGNLHYYQVQFAPTESPFAARASWAEQGRILGIAALAHRAFEEPFIPSYYDTLPNVVANGQAKVLMSKDTMYGFWLDDSITDLSDELIEGFAADLVDHAKVANIRVEFYVPSNSVEYIPDEDFFEDGQKTHTYPIRYTNIISREVRDLKGKGFLVKIEESPDDSEGDEGVPAEVVSEPVTE